MFYIIYINFFARFVRYSGLYGGVKMDYCAIVLEVIDELLEEN